MLKFTSLQQKIITFVIQGLTNTEIMKKLRITENALNQNLSAVYKQLKPEVKQEVIQWRGHNRSGTRVVREFPGTILKELLGRF